MDFANKAGRTWSGPAQPAYRLQGIRFPDRDYRIPAFYLITMTTLGRKPHFGTCENNRTFLNDDGRLVHDLWRRIASDYPLVRTAELVIMPDHLHGIVRVLKHMDKPRGRYFDLCAQGRLLILACRPPATGPEPMTRELCLAMNHWCETIARPYHAIEKRLE